MELDNDIELCGFQPVYVSSETDHNLLLHRSFWKRKLASVYTIFNERTSCNATDSSETNNERPNDEFVKECLDYFSPDFYKMWEHLQSVMKVEFPNVPQENGPRENYEGIRFVHSDILASEVPNLAGGNDHDDEGIAEIIDAIKFQSEVMKYHIKDRYKLIETKKSSFPSWLREAIVPQNMSLDEGLNYDENSSNPNSSRAAYTPRISPVIILRGLYRRKLLAYYNIMGQYNANNTVDDILAAYIGRAAKLVEVHRKEQEKGKVEEFGGWADVINTGNTTSYSKYVIVKYDKEHAADELRFRFEAESFEEMWEKLQKASSFKCPPVFLSKDLLLRKGENVQDNIFSREISKIVHKLSQSSYMGDVEDYFRTMLHTDDNVDPVSCEAMSPITRGTGEALVAGDHSSHCYAVKVRDDDKSQTMIDFRELEFLPTPALIADYHYKKRLQTQTMVKVTKVTLIITGIPFTQYKGLSKEKRARVNEAIVFDMSNLMTQKSKKELRQLKNLKEAKLKDPSLEVEDFDGGKSNTKHLAHSGHDIMQKSEEEGNRDLDSIKKQTETTANVVAKWSELENYGCFADKEVVVLPLDTTITTVTYHAPTNGLEIGMMITPTENEALSVRHNMYKGGHPKKVEELLHTEYIPRLMRRVFNKSDIDQHCPGNPFFDEKTSTVHNALRCVHTVGASLPLTEDILLQLKDKKYLNTKYVPPCLIDVTVSIVTSLPKAPPVSPSRKGGLKTLW